MKLYGGARIRSELFVFLHNRPPHLPKAVLLNGHEKLRGLALALSQGETESVVLARRTGRVTLRAITATETVIVKFWALSDCRSQLRRSVGWTKAQQEWRTLKLLHAAGVPVPKPLDMIRLPVEARYHEALVMTDLGEAVPLGGQVHRFSKEGDSDAVRARDAQVITLTAAMLAVGVTDNDHRMNNFLEDIDNRIWRIDFENAARIWPRPLRDRAVGTMLGALLGSHAWMCRFAPNETRRFAADLAQELRPRTAVRVRARKKAMADLRHLKLISGFDLDTSLDW